MKKQPCFKCAKHGHLHTECTKKVDICKEEKCEKYHTPKAHKNMMEYLEKRRSGKTAKGKKSKVNEVETVEKTDDTKPKTADTKVEEATRDIVKAAIEAALSEDRKIRESHVEQVYVHDHGRNCDRDPIRNPVKICLNMMQTEKETGTKKKIIQKKENTPNWIHKKK